MDRRSFIGSLTAIGCLGAIEEAHASPLINYASDLAAVAGKKSKSGFDDNLVVFISDLHTNPEGYQRDKLKKVVAEILDMKPLPGNVIAMGDVALSMGRPEEYDMAKEIVAPIEEAGIKLTLAMGNHDRRSEFSAKFPEMASRTKVEGRLVYVVETPHADIIVLDTLNQGEDDKQFIVPGTIDQKQFEWLRDTLANYKKPVFVSSHHPLKELPGVSELLIDAPTCCGYIYGHVHCWLSEWYKKNYSCRRILRTLCLPSTGHWGDIGYVTFRLDEDKAVAELKQFEFFFPRPLDEGEKQPQSWNQITKDKDGSTCVFSYEM